MLVNNSLGDVFFKNFSKPNVANKNENKLAQIVNYVLTNFLKF